jgi:hypothetical protein
MALSPPVRDREAAFWLAQLNQPLENDGDCDTIGSTQFSAKSRASGNGKCKFSTDPPF